MFGSVVPRLFPAGTARRGGRTRGFVGHNAGDGSGSWVRLPVSRTHAVELHDLPEEDAAAFMRDARRVSRALIAATGAVKLNYEIHGNTLPHLHMHFFPRYRGDRFEGQPIDPRRVAQPVYGPGDFRKTVDTFLRLISSAG